MKKRCTTLLLLTLLVALLFFQPPLALAQTTQRVLEVKQNIAAMVSEGKSKSVQKVLVLNFDPVFPVAKKKRMHDLMSAWNDPKALSKQYIKAMKGSSHGNALYEIAEWIDLDEMPQADNGRKYNIDEYYTTLKKAQKQWNYWGYSGWQSFGTFDYEYYMSRFNVYQRVESGEIDEVWVFTGPCVGTMAYETIMIGRGAYWCNGPEMVREDCPAFVCYVFNYERDVGCMLEDAGHRFESIMAYELGWDTSKPISQMNDWELFTLYDKIAPGKAACGNVHFAPNSDSDYDWGNRSKVYSSWKDWANNYPNLKGEKKMVSAAYWGNGDTVAHHKWWFSCIPHMKGVNETSGAYNNWWIYFNYPIRE